MASISEAFDTTRERIRQIQAKGLRKLRSPTRSEKLRSFSDNGADKAASASPSEFAANLSAKLGAGGANGSIPTTIAWLEECGLEHAIAGDLKSAVAGGRTEAEVVLGFLHGVIQSRLGELVEREVKRRILKEWKDASPDVSLNDGMRHSLALLDDGFWNWRPLQLDSLAPSANPAS